MIFHDVTAFELHATTTIALSASGGGGGGGHVDFVYVHFTSIFTELAEGLNVETLPQYCRCTSFPVLTVHVLGLGFRTGWYPRIRSAVPVVHGRHSFWIAMAGNFWQSSHYQEWLLDRQEVELGRQKDTQHLRSAEDLIKIHIFFTNFIQCLGGEPLKLRQQVGRCWSPLSRSPSLCPARCVLARARVNSAYIRFLELHGLHGAREVQYDHSPPCHRARVKR